MRSPSRTQVRGRGGAPNLWASLKLLNLLMILAHVMILTGLVTAPFVAPARSAPASSTPTATGSAAKPAAAPGKPASDQANPGLFPTKSKDPIYITSDRLDIYDKEGRAVYSGPSGVVATQGASKLVGTELTAYYERQHDNGGSPAGGQSQQSVTGSAVKRILVKGPVSVVQNDQVATGDAADFDRVQNIVTMTGHVSLTQGPNVTTGEKMIYDLNTGVANVFSGPGTPVKSLFVQGSQAGEPGAPAKPGSGKPASSTSASYGKSSSGKSSSGKSSSGTSSPGKSSSEKTSPAKAANP